MSADIVNEIVKESASQIVRSTVDEMVQDHMAVIKTGDWLEEFILKAIRPNCYQEWYVHVIFTVMTDKSDIWVVI